MLKKQFSNNKNPKIYTESSASMWNDEHISKQMLDVHLNPNIDAASRKHSYISDSSNWINSKIKPKCKILDLGCGPGLYATLLSQAGHKTTGIDISKNSIEYAINAAKKNNLNIHYECKNYLDIEYENQFDVVLLIYCDFGVLSFKNQKVILQKIYKSLKINGIFIFDVLSHKHFEKFQESKSRRIEQFGFWRPTPHLILKENIKYALEKVILEKYQIIEDDRSECYHNWNKCFDKTEIDALLNSVGFNSIETYSNASGKAYNQDSDTIASLVTKQ